MSDDTDNLYKLAIQYAEAIVDGRAWLTDERFRGAQDLLEAIHDFIANNGYEDSIKWSPPKR